MGAKGFRYVHTVAHRIYRYYGAESLQGIAIPLTARGILCVRLTSFVHASAALRRRSNTRYMARSLTRHDGDLHPARYVRQRGARTSGVTMSSLRDYRARRCSSFMLSPSFAPLGKVCVRTLDICSA